MNQNITVAQHFLQKKMINFLWTAPAGQIQGSRKHSDEPNLMPLLHCSQTNIYKKSYGEWVKTGRNGSKFTIKKMLHQHNGYYHLIFNKKFCLYQTFLDLQFCYYKKGSPVRFLINSGSCWRKPTAKIRSFTSTVLGELNKEWLSLQNIVIKQLGNRTWQKKQARRNFSVSKSSHVNG